MPRPLCFVLMPFGRKISHAGIEIDFDAVYEEIIKAAIDEAGLEPIRADEEKTGGIIHKPMFERLVLCEYAVADLTTVNANVFYELGVRHALIRSGTALMFARGHGDLPFDVKQLRAMPYNLGIDGRPSDAEVDRAALVNILNDARARDVDSPLYQLLKDYPDIDHTKTDVFREVAVYSETIRKRLAKARRTGDTEEVRSVENELGSLKDVEAGVLIDLLLSYRAVSGWGDMVRLVEDIPEHIRATDLVREQYGLALNRAGRGDEAEDVLVRLIEERGPSSETYGILGRVYKDRWEGAYSAGKEPLARGALAKAVDAYMKGFEADWRDAYPGINAATLMRLMDPPDPRADEVIPVVEYAVRRKMARRADYWDYATMLELAVLASDRGKAEKWLSDALANVREPWEAGTTLKNLGYIRDARFRRGEDTGWLEGIMDALEDVS